MLRVTKDRKRRYVSLGISVNPEHWDFSKNQPKSDCPNREFIELMIAEKLKAYNSTIIELKATNQDFTSTSLVDKVDGGNSLVRKTVNELFVEHLQRLENEKTQFAQIVGRMRLYQALPNRYQRNVPKLLITDSQINNVCRDFYADPNFGVKDNTISMFDFHNLLTEANKSSYIDSYLQRAVNATEVSVGICNALHGDSQYAWFLG